MIKKKVCIIIPYFGELPNNMYTFLLSCKYNSRINWLILTDQDVSKYHNLCNNVKFIKSNLYKIKETIENITSSKVILNKPYKLCDYRPLYGLIFSKYLKNYDYWGYSDLDVVYGNLFRYISYGVENGYQKIGSHGHFTLIKNDDLMNHLYKYPIYKHGRTVFLFENIVSKTPKACHFDEFNGIDTLCDQYHIKTYNNINLVNDISFENLDLRTRDKRYISKECCYVWHNGHALYYYKKNNKIYKHEYGYFHFQKRHSFYQFITTNILYIHGFSITTYGYNKIGKIDKDSIISSIRMNSSSFCKRLTYLLRWYVFSSYIFHVNFYRLFHRLFISHNFRI